MQLLHPRRLCTLVTASRHLHSLQVRHSLTLVRALCDSRLPRRQERLSHYFLRHARSEHVRVPFLADQTRFLSLRGGKSADHRPQETSHVCLEVDGLTCGSCVAKVERALLSVDGALEVGERNTYSLLRILFNKCSQQLQHQSRRCCVGAVYRYMCGNSPTWNSVIITRRDNR